jgi:hypothetical protein
MINYSSVLWKNSEDKANKKENGIAGMAIAYVVDGEVAHTDVIDASAGSILCSADSFTENAIDESNGTYTVNIIKDSANIDTVVCDEMIYSILLSNAKVFNIDDGHEYARLVAPGWKYLDDTFKLPGEYE